MNCESNVLPPPVTVQPLFSPPAVIGQRPEARTVLARPGELTVNLELAPTASRGTGMVYTIVIRNTGQETLFDVEVSETLICPPWPSKATVFSETTPIRPGDQRVIPRLDGDADGTGHAFIVTTVMAHCPGVGLVYRSCHLEVNANQADQGVAIRKESAAFGVVAGTACPTFGSAGTACPTRTTPSASWQAQPALLIAGGSRSA